MLGVDPGVLLSWVKVKLPTNFKQLNFLDVTLDLVYDNFQPYMKNNDNPIYIHPN